jgi:hypothetical protein
MSWLSSIFGGQSRPPLQHPLFGELHWSRTDGWVNDNFELWGYKGIQLLIDAPADGPSLQQENAFRAFVDQRETLLPRCIDEVDRVREELEVEASTFVITGLTIPSLATGKNPLLWTLWFDLKGDDHFMYGVQTDDAWVTLIGFADD